MTEETYNNIGNAAVERATGKGWLDWFAVLDAWGAKNRLHAEIAEYLLAEQSVPAWWCQMVTVGYEQSRGLRVKNQKSDWFAVSVSKVFPYTAEQVYEAWQDGPRRKWLADDLTITTQTKPKSIRGKLPDGSRISVGLYPRRDGKVQLSMQQEKLKNQDLVEKQRAFWKQSFARLSSYLA